MIEIFTVTTPKEYKEVLSANIGKEILLRDLWVDDLVMCGTPKINHSVQIGVLMTNEVWKINFGAELARYLFRDEFLKKEIFFEKLKTEFPAHFEALLFYPELMQ